MRCWEQGWKKNSGSAEDYTRAYRQKRVMKFLLDLQKKDLKISMQSIVTKDDDY
ncbi:hypothetical protein D3C80_1828800 [compost metagenome]